ncbi:MAG: hypothetical protein O9972_04160 [Burkholderiales bacterium]|nr:hypothetical protein [Burkholderiales bacterium]
MAHRGSLLVWAAAGGRVGGDYGSAVARRGSVVHAARGSARPDIGPRRTRGRPGGAGAAPPPRFRDPRDTPRRGAGTRR